MYDVARFHLKVFFIFIILLNDKKKKEKLYLWKIELQKYGI